jgi:formylglycine-generating enzyme required for sulfatase activity
MVDIPAGTFWMGCNEAVDGECEGDEKPYHQVTLSTYRIDTYEVSAGAYKEYLAAVGPGCTNPGDGEACWPDKDLEDDRLNVNVEGREAYPANGPGWYQSDGYCRWAGRSLCTEAQWEYAARGSDGRKYPWGNDCPASWGDKCDGPEWTKLTAKANCEDSNCHDGFSASDTGTSPVGSFPSGASPFGVMDMEGNVCEYVKDWYASDYYCKGPEADTSGQDNPCKADPSPFQLPWTDPQGPPEGSKTVIRGASYYPISVSFFPLSLRTSDREKGSFSARCIETGFRCCSKQ